MSDSLSNSTPKDDCQAPEIKANDSKTFILSDSEKKNYEFTIIYSDPKELLLQAREINDISDFIFKASLTLEDFYKINRFFMIYESLNTIFLFFKNEIEEKDMFLKIDDNNIIISLKYKIMKTEQNIVFTLIRQEVKIEDISRNLCQKVKEIDALRKEIDNLCELFLGFNKEDINKYYEIMKKNSDILDSKEEFIQIIKGIKKSFEFKIKDIILLFKASKDGDSASAFHKKCDGKQFTITLVKTTKGKRFGGFTRIAWHQNGSYSNDRYAFIFSFNNKENYYIYNYDGENAIYGDSSYGPTFGDGYDFCISNGCKSNKDSSNGMSSYYHTCLKSPLSGEYNFMVEDYEVFQLDLNNYNPKKNLLGIKNEFFVNEFVEE